MGKVEVQKVADPNGKSLPIFTDIARRFEEIEKRAFELFQKRGGFTGHEQEDWFQAEREIAGVTATELVEKDGQYQLEMALPGFEAKDVEVTATPEEIIVRATAEQEKKQEEKGKVIWSEFGSSEVYRRFAVPKAIAVDKVAAKMEKGILKITAPEEEAPQAEKPKAMAAMAG